MLDQILKDARHKGLVKMFNNTIRYRYFEDFGITFYFLRDTEFKPIDDFNTDDKRVYLEEYLKMDDIVTSCISEFIKNNK